MRRLAFLLSILSSLSGFSQFTLSYPVDRMVIQRDLSNQGVLQIAGSFTQKTDSLQVKFDPVLPGQGTKKDWETIVKHPEKAQFIEKATLSGGWYKLSIRSFENGQITKTSTVEHVGVGEVFVIAGQSNAEGNSDFEGSEIGTTEDRVSVIDYKDIYMDEDLLPFQFSPLRNNTKIGPYNPVPWFWAGMAENIVKKYNVPVLLYGAAVGGTGSDLWFGSMKGTDYSKVLGRQIKFVGSPYDVLRRTLQNYVSRTGIRALLWQQGESDAFTPAYTYYTRLKDIVAQTSLDIEGDLSWIVAIGSRTPNPTQVAYAQQLLIDNVDKVYLGPNTDILWGGENRADGIHFHKEGLKRAADLWSDAIIDHNYLGKIRPVTAKGLIEFSVSCPQNLEERVSLMAPENYEFYQWSDGTSDPTAGLNSESISLKARKNGIVYFSPEITFQQNAFNKEQITLVGDSEFCEGSPEHYLIASTSFAKWNTGEEGQKINPTLSGTYSYFWKNLYGCTYKSDEIAVKVNPKPEPKIEYSTGQNRFCENESVTLQTTQNFSNYVWSNGETSELSAYQSEGSHYLRVTDDLGCSSDTLHFELAALKAPQKPIIEQTSPFSLNSSETLQWFKDDNNLDYYSSQFKPAEPGAYYAKAKIAYTMEGSPELVCYSEKSDILEFSQADFNPPIQIWPNPSSDQIFIEMLNEPQDLNITIADKSRKNVLTSVIKYSEGKFASQSISHLPPGLYTVKLGSRSNYVSHKLIVH